MGVQNEPNPFTSSTAIRFENPDASLVSLRVLDASGRLVAEPFQEVLPAGAHVLRWERQWKDVLGLLEVQGALLDQVYLDRRAPP